jgi:hypothetical protein
VLAHILGRSGALVKPFSSLQSRSWVSAPSLCIAQILLRISEFDAFNSLLRARLTGEKPVEGEGTQDRKSTPPDNDRRGGQTAKVLTSVTVIRRPSIVIPHVHCSENEITRRTQR